MAKNRKDDYEIGYGRPPKRSQFKPGQSGNPKGRPKKRLDVASTLERTLAEPITCLEGDQLREMSAKEAALYKQICKAMQGDLTAFDAVMRQAKRHRLLSADRADRSGAPGLVINAEKMTVEEWEEAAWKQQAASKAACDILTKEWLDE